jgi:hypothetical protein
MMAKTVSGAPGNLRTGSIVLSDHNPVKLVDARAERRELLITFNSVEVQIGDAGITSAFGGGFAQDGTNKIVLATAAEVWCVLRDGFAGPRTVHFMELYD